MTENETAPEADVSWTYEPIVTALAHASDRGEPGLALDALQQVVGFGTNDLLAGMQGLAAAGRISEVAPGLWAAELEPEPVGQRIVDVPGGDHDAEPPVTMADVNRVREEELEATARAVNDFNRQSEVRLSRAMVSALEDAALGAVVRAGIEGVPAGPFVLVVE